MVQQHVNTGHPSYTGCNLQVWTTDIASCDNYQPQTSYSTMRAPPTTLPNRDSSKDITILLYSGLQHAENI